MTSTSKTAPLTFTSQWAQCRAENQQWALSVASYEQEIDELLDLLTDAVKNQYRSLRHRATDYTTTLGGLKLGFDRIQHELLCPLNHCDSAECSCGDAHFRRYISVPHQFEVLKEEFNRAKEGCYQLLSVMVELNLL